MEVEEWEDLEEAFHSWTVRRADGLVKLDSDQSFQVVLGLVKYLQWCIDAAAWYEEK